MSETQVLRALHDFDPSLALHVIAERDPEIDRQYDGAVIETREGAAALPSNNTVFVKLTEFGQAAAEVIRYKKINDATRRRRFG